MGENTDCGSVADADVLSFLVGNGQLTRYRANKYSALTGFYRYAISNGYAERSPLPAPEDEPRTPRSAPPYVFSRKELQRLFGVIDVSQQRPVQLEADILRALYGAGLHFGEAQHLTLEDADPRRPKPKGTIMKLVSKDLAGNPIPDGDTPGRVNPKAGIRQHISFYVTLH